MSSHTSTAGPVPAEIQQSSPRARRTHPNASKSVLAPTALSEVHDLVCVGFGPASLAVAVALHDNLVNNILPSNPKVTFLEKQDRFAWHAGMLLPGAKMQISFIKDMATLRDPRSHFTFLNYLHHQGRLVEFTNLGTFLPSRVEYEDYLRWCAAHFDDVVQYQQQVVSVSPDKQNSGPVKIFTITSRDATTGKLSTVRSRNVLIAVGGQPSIPKSLPSPHPKVIHSSQYAYMVPRLLKDTNAPYRVAVVGAGQSAAEIFNNIQGLYPNSKTWLVMRSEFLKPSDDSPFVNSIFNPSYTDSLFPRSQEARRALIQDAKATNYGVVRLELIEHLYEKMYDQKREFGDDERQWPHRVMGSREIVEVGQENGSLQLRLRLHDETLSSIHAPVEEILDADLVIAATGYQRNAHLDMLRDSWGMLPSKPSEGAAQFDGWEVKDESTASGCRRLEVGRDYRVQYSAGTVASDSGVYLQGCCEMTHGLSDTLLSVLANRSGEIVDSIFPWSARARL
ncbi:L-lysine 6-monooxygenase (NADPH-requiring)-domain-containing protein [Plectosphaerella cucumerina]|uniref:L-ornithine N(5)-monooxygenase [NAD(P)H] n=1 Tax=Plectosphaerella cucumerina TaxID=40658 RepID=A0A8K0T3W6_9PEZI|nr:L-lysine 6-monooxygenase (NADPH-requiring)-domain-containing protein [Plectosphaerella cucumerina]